jgi:hypothetical protein
MSRDVHRCTHWPRPRNPSPIPRIGIVYESAIGQQKQTTSLCNPLIVEITSLHLFGFLGGHISAESYEISKKLRNCVDRTNRRKTRLTEGNAKCRHVKKIKKN